MPRYKHYLDVDVVTAAKRRLHHVFDIFDSVAVSFSGGKDSLCVLELAREVAAERGLDQIDAFFYDEEVIPPSVIETVEHYRAQPWCRLRYFAYPLKSAKFILGRTINYTQWDPAREHIRPLPAHAITPPPGEVVPDGFDQYQMNAVMARQLPGRCAFVTGIRAAESLIRLRSVVNKVHENYITQPRAYDRRVCLAKPIYDWQENDVLKFIDERGLVYADCYNQQHRVGVGLRVATALIPENAKRFDRYREMDPAFFERVIAVFPEMLVQDRYWKDFDGAAVAKLYGADFAGVERYIRERIDDPGQQALALKRLKNIKGRSVARPNAYPPAHVIKYFVSGAYKRTELLPMMKD